MSNKFNKNCYWVIPDDNDMLVYDVNGNLIGGQISSRVTCDLGSVPVCIFKTVVNVASTYQEMMEQLNKWKEDND